MSCSGVEAVHLPSAWDPLKVGLVSPPSDWEYPSIGLFLSHQTGISLRAGVSLKSLSVSAGVFRLTRPSVLGAPACDVPDPRRVLRRTLPQPEQKLPTGL